MTSENDRPILNHYVLIVKTLRGDPGEKLIALIKGTNGQTEKLALEKSQVEVRVVYL